MKNFRSFIIAVILIPIAVMTQAQSVGINSNGSLPNNSAMLDVSATNKGLLIPQVTLTSTTDATTIELPATSLLVFNTITAGTIPNDIVPGYYYNAGTPSTPIWTKLITSNGTTHYVGELFGGGIVFWIDNSGQHGLIVSLVDISTSSTWSDVSGTLIGSAAQSTWNGQSNSLAIIGQNGHTTSAAKKCDDYTNADYGTGIFSDWYLPAIDQLSLIYQARYILNKNIEGTSATNILSLTYYWSSTERTNTLVWFQYFGYGNAYFDYSSKNNTNSVRAIRSF